MAARRKIILGHYRAPGDITVMTALVRDIALTHPNKFEIGVHTSCPDLWQNNPYITDLGPLKAIGGKKKSAEYKPPSGIEYFKLTYGRGIRDQKYETIHFLPYFHKDFFNQAKVKVPLHYPWPDLHLSQKERSTSLVNGRYWLFLSGGKSDFTAKVWDHRYWARTVSLMKDQGLQMVQTGASPDTHQGHWHPTIPGALNLVGFGGQRELLQLIHHAEGVICAVTFAMHAAAALHKPCVVIAGGREAWWWEAYVPENKGLGIFGPPVANKLRVPHRYLHTIGLLDCCERHGCWKNKVQELNGDKKVCVYPIVRPGQAIPKCLDMITPEMVVQAALSYYYDGTISPPPGTRVEEDVRAMGIQPCMEASQANGVGQL
jgi:ADP-heptose:LPS heptosyltransferase